jgi:hypothetical protein
MGDVSIRRSGFMLPKGFVSGLVCSASLRRLALLAKSSNIRLGTDGGCALSFGERLADCMFKMTLLQFLRHLHEGWVLGALALSRSGGDCGGGGGKKAADREVLRSHLLIERFLRCLRFSRPAVPHALSLVRGPLRRRPRRLFTAGTGATHV